MNAALFDFKLYLTLAFGGVFVFLLLFKLYHKLLGKKEKKYQFNIGRVIYMFFMPLLAVFVMYLKLGSEVLNVFFGFAIAGTILEWFIGFTYERIVGKKLWTYHIYTFAGNTSVLSIPLWGLCGVMFWLLARVYILK